MTDLLYAVKMAYRKHLLNDESIGWGELSDVLQVALCNAMGDDEFIIWIESVKGIMQDQQWAKGEH